MSHPADVHVLGTALVVADKIAESSFLKPKLASRVNPLPSVDLSDIKAAEEVVEDMVLGEYHICGSVAMGDALDSHLRVKGAKGLRVIDASAFPNNVSGNICSSVYALAEKGADIIKADSGYAVLDKIAQLSVKA